MVGAAHTTHTQTHTRCPACCCVLAAQTGPQSSVQAVRMLRATSGPRRPSVGKKRINTPRSRKAHKPLRVTRKQPSGIRPGEKQGDPPGRSLPSPQARPAGPGPRAGRCRVVREGRRGGPPGARPLPPRLLETPGLPSPSARHIWFHSGPPPPPGAFLPRSSPLSEKQRFLKTQSHTHSHLGGGRGGEERRREKSRREARSLALPLARPPKLAKLAAPYPGGRRWRQRPRGGWGGPRADPREAGCSAAGDEARAREPAGGAPCPRRAARGARGPAERGAVCGAAGAPGCDGRPRGARFLRAGKE